MNPIMEMVTLGQKERENYKQLFASKVVAYEDLQVGESIGEGELESWHNNNNDLTDLLCLFSGAFGKVLKGHYTKDSIQHKVAIKTLKSKLFLLDTARST